MARSGAWKDERKANRRGAARLAAVQALYQMDIAGTGVNDILAEFESHWIGREVEGAQYLPAEAAFFRDVVSGVVREPRHLAAEAEVLAGAEAEMALRPAIDVVDVRVGKFPPIAIAGAECKRHFV